jgi:hypothetical protein
LCIGGIYGVKGAVASGLVADVLKNPNIEPRPQLKAGPSPFIEFIVPAHNEAANIQPCRPRPGAGCNASPHAGRLLFEDSDTRHHPLMLAFVVRQAEEHTSLLFIRRP